MGKITENTNTPTNSSLEFYFKEIISLVKTALEDIDNYDFKAVKDSLKKIKYNIRMIRPSNNCGWCGHKHKTIDCPKRSPKGGFYFELEYAMCDYNYTKMISYLARQKKYFPILFAEVAKKGMRQWFDYNAMTPDKSRYRDSDEILTELYKMLECKT